MKLGMESHVKTVEANGTIERGGLFAPPFFFFGVTFHKAIRTIW